MAAVDGYGEAVPTTPPWSVSRLDHDGLTFDVGVGGSPDGEPVVLLHGFPQGARSWRAVVELLADEGLLLLVPEQRGYSPGARPVSTDAYAMPRLVGDVLAVAAAHGHGRFHLVGHDWGASVAWTVAAERPEVVRSLVAVSVPHLAAYGTALREDADQQERSAYLKDFRRPAPAPEADLLAHDAARLRAVYGAQVPPEDVEAYVAAMREGALGPALNWYRAMGRDLGDLPPVVAPTTYVWGDQDPFAGRSGAEGCARHVRGDYRFVDLPGVGHWVPEEVPAVLAREIVDRVRSARR